MGEPAPIPTPPADMLDRVRSRFPRRRRGPGRPPGPARSAKKLDLEDLDGRYLDLLATIYTTTETMSLSKIANVLGCTTTSTAHAHVGRLIRAGLLRRTSTGRRGGYAVTVRGVFLLHEALGYDRETECPACRRPWPNPPISCAELVWLEELIECARAGTVPETPPAPPVPDGLDAGCVMVLRADRDLGRHAGEAGRPFFPPPDLAFDDRRLLAYAEGFRAGRVARKEKEQNP